MIGDKYTFPSPLASVPVPGKVTSWKSLAVQLNSTFDTTERNQIAIEMQQQLLDDNAFVFCSFLEMSMISQANVTGLTAHACDYYELTADLDIN